MKHYLNVAKSNPLPPLPRIGVARSDEVTDEDAVPVDELVPVETDIRVVDGEAGQLPGELFSGVVRFHSSEVNFRTGNCWPENYSQIRLMDYRIMVQF